MSGLPAADTARHVTVVKLGGRALEGPDAAAALAADVAALDGRVAIVHGGGSEASAWCARLGIAPRFHDGLRVTDDDALPVVVAVLAGLANKRLVAALRAHDIHAAGVSALDGGLLQVAAHPLADALGAVGAVRGADPALVEALWSAGITPVIASIAAGPDGALLNVNADDVAAALAAALGARLLLLSDTPGLLLDGAPVASLAVSDIEMALARPDVTGGMRPKLRAAATAIAAGARSVTLADWRGAGTLSHALSGARGTTLVPDLRPVESTL